MTTPRRGRVPDAPPDALTECQDCGRRAPAGELRPLPDVLARVAPGEVMPAGECRECGAVAHLVVSQRITVTFLVADADDVAAGAYLDASLAYMCEVSDDQRRIVSYHIKGGEPERCPHGYALDDACLDCAAEASNSLRVDHPDVDRGPDEDSTPRNQRDPGDEDEADL